LERETEQLACTASLDPDHPGKWRRIILVYGCKPCNSVFCENSEKEAASACARMQSCKPCHLKLVRLGVAPAGAGCQWYRLRRYDSDGGWRMADGTTRMVDGLARMAQATCRTRLKVRLGAVRAGGRVRRVAAVSPRRRLGAGPDAPSPLPYLPFLPPLPGALGTRHRLKRAFFA
jgi:hypothetical protein